MWLALYFEWCFSVQTKYLNLMPLVWNLILDLSGCEKTIWRLQNVLFGAAHIMYMELLFFFYLMKIIYRPGKEISFENQKGISYVSFENHKGTNAIDFDQH